MYVEDRSSAEADWRCGMERYWLTEYRTPQQPEAVGGIVPVKSVVELEVGAAFADGVALLIHAADDADARAITTLVSAPILTRYGPEVHSLVAGLLYAAHLHVIPRLKVDYDILAVEPEMFYTAATGVAAGKYMVMIRPDLALRHRASGAVWAPDWKTTSYKDTEWIMKWPWAIQTHLQASALKQTHQDWDVQGSIILGAYKGYRDDSGTIKSPFTYCYSSGVGGSNGWAPKWVRGWQQIPVWTRPGGIFQWVEDMLAWMPTVIREQFPVSPPIMLRDDMVEMFCQERFYRMQQIHEWRASKGLIPLAAVFDHRTARCQKCPYMMACWNPATRVDPLAKGQYTPRVPNHELERLALKLAGEK